MFDSIPRDTLSKDHPPEQDCGDTVAPTQRMSQVCFRDDGILAPSDALRFEDYSMNDCVTYADSNDALLQ